jgi:hypothetical protein
MAHEATDDATTDDICALSRQELRAMLRAPFGLADLVLGQRRRLAMNMAQEHRLPTLALVLTAATVGFALPFGAVLGPARCWRVAALWLGGVAICLPSLQVFGTYLGARLTWMQTLCVSLTASATAALFTFAFAPILAFVRLTMAEGRVVDAHDGATLFLVVSMLAGVGQLLRFLRRGTALAPVGRSLEPVLFPWLALFLFINLRLASVLDLL